MGLDPAAERLDPELLGKAEELFFTGTVSKIIPVRQIGDRKLDPVPGPVTSRLAERLARITSGADDAYADWLIPCR
jgi:branched-subunit amino acid aminotransferase/4-amino-4-deoxychorismate lyase